MSTIYTCDKCHKKIKEKEQEISGGFYGVPMDNKYKNCNFCEKCAKLFLIHLQKFY